MVAIENNKLIKLGNIYPSGGQNGNIYHCDGISPTISSGETNTKGNGGVGSNNAPKILININELQEDNSKTILKGELKLNREKITMIELFSGIGAQIRGTNNTQLWDCTVVNTSDIDKDAMVSYAAVHCGLTNKLIDTYTEYPTREEMAQYLTDRNIGFDFKKNQSYDWFKLAKRKNNELNKYYLACVLSHNLGDISSIKSLDYADFWTYSFPCFTGDTLVLTKEFGYIPIKDIKEGMSVLTHNNTYQIVTQSMMTGKKNIYSIQAMCFDDMKCTDNHRFYVRTRHRVGTRIKGKAVNYRYFDEPTWKECKNLSKDDYLGYAINQNSIIPNWVDSPETKVKISTLMDNKDFWWLIGRYIADGFKQTSKTGSKIVICCGSAKVNLGLIEKHLNACGLKYCTDDHKSCMNYHISSNELYKFVSQFGDKAHGKFIPSFVFDMPIDLCQAFFDGYWSGDGCFTNSRFKATSVSRELIYGLGHIIAKIYHRPFSIYYTKRKPTTIIEGRIVNQKDTYTIMFSKENAKQDKAFYENGYIWFPINQIKNTNTTQDVYDITVENDHSFTANGAIVHNCQDISVAGNQAGIVKGQTRSGLLYEVERLLETAVTNGNQPKYLLLENVKNLVGKQFKAQFDEWLNRLDELGYSTYWEVVNGKDCGIPQNRERVFALSIRKDIDTSKFKFATPFDNGLRLRDMLQSKVEDNYYLSEKIQQRFVLGTEGDNIIGRVPNGNGTNYSNDMVFHTENNVGVIKATDYKDPKKILDCYGIDKSVNQTSIIDIANCITAREDRGVSNRKSEGTAVVETSDQQYIDNISDKYSFAKRKAQDMLNENGNLPEMFNPYNNYEVTDFAPTQTSACDRSASTATVLKKEPNYRIRKLTPTECWRLMGFNDDDVEKSRAVKMSDTALYKQAGNSIITNCISLIMEHLYKAQIDDTYICSDENFT